MKPFQMRAAAPCCPTIAVGILEQRKPRANADPRILWELWDPTAADPAFESAWRIDCAHQRIRTASTLSDFLHASRR
jgi:hypothetical protein